MQFSLDDGAYRYRPLKLTEPLQRGFDVFALQTGLLGAGYLLPASGADGFLGGETDRAIRMFQRQRKSLHEDGIAGVMTQRVLAMTLSGKAAKKYKLPAGLLYGQLEHESSFWLGNHTPPYDDGARDCGVAQRNTRYTPMESGFDADRSISALASHVSSAHARYSKVVTPARRAWELAAGSWNAPSWTDKLARGETLTPIAQAHIDAYIAAVTTYVKW